MDRDKLKKCITWITVTWVLIGLVLFGLTAGGILTKQIFQYTFAGGFVIYVILVTVLSHFLHNNTEQ